MRGNRKGLARKVFKGWNWSIATISIMTAVMIFPFIFVSWEYMRLGKVNLDVTLTSFGLHGSSWLLFMIYFSTVQPFLEEIYWRGYLRTGPRYIAWTDLAFAGYHLLVLARFIKAPWLLAAFLVLTLVACLWRHIASRLDGLLVPLLSHAVADASIVAVTCVLIRQ